MAVEIRLGSLWLQIQELKLLTALLTATPHFRHE